MSNHVVNLTGAWTTWCACTSRAQKMSRRCKDKDVKKMSGRYGTAISDVQACHKGWGIMQLHSHEVHQATQLSWHVAEQGRISFGSVQGKLQSRAGQVAEQSRASCKGTALQLPCSSIRREGYSGLEVH